jgi:ribosomal protein S27E
MGERIWEKTVRPASGGEHNARTKKSKSMHRNMKVEDFGHQRISAAYYGRKKMIFCKNISEMPIKAGQPMQYCTDKKGKIKTENAIPLVQPILICPHCNSDKVVYRKYSKDYFCHNCCADLILSRGKLLILRTIESSYEKSMVKELGK